MVKCCSAGEMLIMHAPNGGMVLRQGPGSGIVSPYQINGCPFCCRRLILEGEDMVPTPPPPRWYRRSPTDIHLTCRGCEGRFQVCDECAADGARREVAITAWASDR